jgi:hypothetical protein
MKLNAQATDLKQYGVAARYRRVSTLSAPAEQQFQVATWGDGLSRTACSDLILQPFDFTS